MWQSFKKYYYIFIKYAAPIGLFFLLPMLVALYLGHNIITLEKSKHISTLSTQLENNMKDLESEIPSKSFMLKVARGAWFTLKNNENQEENFWNYYDNLCSFLSSKPDIYLFDEKGSLVTPKKINLKSRFMATKLWQTVCASYEDRTESAHKLKKQFQGFLGNEFKLGIFLESRNRLMPIIVNTKVGYVYWMNYPENAKKGIFIIFWDTPSLEFRFNQIINRYTNKFDYAFTRDIFGKVKVFAKGPSFDPNLNNTYLRTALLEAQEGYLDSQGLLWKSVKFENFWLMASLKSKALKFDNYRFFYVKTIIFLFIIIILVYIWLTSQQLYYLSIKTKILGLFLISVFAPVMEFAFLGYQYLDDMRNNLHTEIWNDGRNILHSMDKELGSTSNRFREEFRKIIKDFQEYDLNEKARQNINESLAKNELVAIERRLASDASVIKQITNYLAFEGINVVTDPIAKHCIDTMLRSNLMDSVDPVLRTAMDSPEFGLTLFSTKPDNVHNFTFGSLQFYLYWCFSQSKEYGKEYYLILRMTDNVLKNHLKERLNQCKNNIKEKDYIITICNDKKDEWYPDNSLSKDLKAISRRINYVNKPIESEIIIGSKSYLLLCLKSVNLNGYSFYALYPNEKIENKLNRVRNQIIACIILFIAIALLIGYRLSATFLYPIRRLEEGVKAIKQRKTEFRIESLQNDEFGALAMSFNKMIADLKEMELAKYIQESLLPKSLPKLKGYEILFSNRMASAVGGDYFDTILLDDDNLCVIIGDVSGHGVASALVMAIAKAVLYHGFNRTRNLFDLFSDLNAVITTYFFKPPVKKMITLFATIINLPTGKATFLDFGHNFPMKISKKGEITELKMIGAPVGALKRMKPKPIDEFIIEEGESIVFYTDGIIEATGKTTEQYGYDRFKECLSVLSDESPERIIKLLFEKYDEWEDGTEPDDDVTLAVLKRISS